MGRAFAAEIEALAETYTWAHKYDVSNLRNAIRYARGPLLVIGSGGSFTAATYAAFLHERLQGELARPTTPLETILLANRLRAFHGLLISAGGRNKDILAAFEALKRAEPITLSVLCGTTNSPLASHARDTFGAVVEELKLPNGRDGFLATNSLLAFCILLFRAHERPEATQLPATLPQLLGISGMDAYSNMIASESQLVAERETILAIHGPSMRAAAIDLESKCSESALASVLVTDYRNFGHGRHHWLAKRADSTGIVAFIHDSDEHLATRTLKLMPADVPVLRVRASGSTESATLCGLVATFHLTRQIGRQRSIDPGRPGVPAFGSRVYSLRIPRVVPESMITAAARRKCKAAAATGGELEAWEDRATRALDTLANTAVTAVALDYDGTLCPAAERFKGLRASVGKDLARLSDLGLLIGIATGRGQSVTRVLRDALPNELWSSVIVGYYNGGYVLPLDADLPAESRMVSPELEGIATRLQRDETLMPISTVTIRHYQVTVECDQPDYIDVVWDRVQSHVASWGATGLMAVKSGHAIDVLAPGVTKLAVVQAIEKRVAGPVLRIGDRGRFPGNDFAFLDSAVGLSVDEVSTSPDTCWNFSRSGVRGVESTQDYLRSIVSSSRGCRVCLVGGKA